MSVMSKVLQAPDHTALTGGYTGPVLSHTNNTDSFSGIAMFRPLRILSAFGATENNKELES